MQRKIDIFITQIFIWQHGDFGDEKNEWNDSPLVGGWLYQNGTKNFVLLVQVILRNFK